MMGKKLSAGATLLTMLKAAATGGVEVSTTNMKKCR